MEVRSSSRNTEKNIRNVLFSFRWKKLGKILYSNVSKELHTLKGGNQKSYLLAGGT